MRTLADYEKNSHQKVTSAPMGAVIELPYLDIKEASVDYAQTLAEYRSIHTETPYKEQLRTKIVSYLYTPVISPQLISYMLDNPKDGIVWVYSDTPPYVELKRIAALLGYGYPDFYETSLKLTLFGQLLIPEVRQSIGGALSLPAGPRYAPTGVRIQLAVDTSYELTQVPDYESPPYARDLCRLLYNEFWPKRKFFGRTDCTYIMLTDSRDIKESEGAYTLDPTYYPYTKEMELYEPSTESYYEYHGLSLLASAKGNA